MLLPQDAAVRKKRFSPQPDKAMRIVGSGRDGNLP
jgi:hypothetical protein